MHVWTSWPSTFQASCLHNKWRLKVNRKHFESNKATTQTAITIPSITIQYNLPWFIDYCQNNTNTLDSIDEAETKTLYNGTYNNMIAIIAVETMQYNKHSLHISTLNQYKPEVLCESGVMSITLSLSVGSSSKTLSRSSTESRSSSELLPRYSRLGNWLVRASLQGQWQR